MTGKKWEPKNDPVYKDRDNLWYFWDETWSGKFGPYSTEEVARERMEEYCNFIDGCGYN